MYEKMTFEVFKTSLAEGKYSAAGGARRALGKSSLSDKEKKLANTLINERFAAEEEKAGKTPKKAAAKKEPKVVTKKHRADPSTGAVSKDGYIAPNSVSAPVVEAAETPTTYIEAAERILNFSVHARQEIDHLQTISPELNTTQERSELAEFVRSAIAHMKHAVTSLPKPQTEGPLLNQINVPDSSQNGLTAELNS